MKSRRATSSLLMIYAVVGLVGLSTIWLWNALHPTALPSPPPAATSAASYPSATHTLPGVSSSHTVAKCYPTNVKVPSVGIDESIVPMGLTVNGTIEPPPQQTIWYDGSPLPGQKGNSIIAGHVSYGEPSVFWKLSDVSVGARVTIGCNDGASLHLQVIRKASVDKTALEVDQSVWGDAPSPRVILITCDKKSPRKGGHLTNNYVVWTQVVSS